MQFFFYIMINDYTNLGLVIKYMQCNCQKKWNWYNSNIVSHYPSDLHMTLSSVISTTGEHCIPLSTLQTIWLDFWHVTFSIANLDSVSLEATLPSSPVDPWVILLHVNVVWDRLASDLHTRIAVAPSTKSSGLTVIYKVAVDNRWQGLESLLGYLLHYSLKTWWVPAWQKKICRKCTPTQNYSPW